MKALPYLVIPLLLHWCLSLQYPEPDLTNAPEEGVMLLWQELKKQIQRIEKDRASDLQRINSLELENGELRHEIDSLWISMRKEPLANEEDGNQTSGESDSKTESAEFLPLSDGIINEVELLRNGEKQANNIIQLINEQEKKIDWLTTSMDIIARIAEECCINKSSETSVNRVPLEIAYSPTEMEILKENVHNLNIGISELRSNQSEMKDVVQEVRVQLEHIKNELTVAKNEHQELKEGCNGTMNEGRNEEETLFNSAEKNEEEFSGEDPSGWQSVPFFNHIQSNVIPQMPIMSETERTAREAFSMVIQMKLKLDFLEKEISIIRISLDKPRINESQIYSLTNTIEFIQEAVLNITQHIMDGETMQQKERVQIRRDFSDVSKQVRLWGLQVEKAKHLAQVVKDRQMDQFTAIQQFRQDMNDMETNVLKLGLKLTTLQSDLLNATISNYKSDNRDLLQDVKISDLYTKTDRIEGKFPEVHQLIKDVLAALRSKSDKGELKLLATDVMAASEKLQAIYSLNRTVNYLAQAVQLLETQLPQECSSSSSSSAAASPLHRSSTLLIKPKGSSKSVLVQCEFDPWNNVAWTIIQQRNKGSVDFNRSWDEYRYGFGDTNGDHWLGNEYVHFLTTRGDMVLRIDVLDVFGDYHYAEYRTFWISSFEDGFRIHVGDYSGNLTDALLDHNGMMFSTFDVDRDTSSTHCGRFYASGWWFSNCQKANLNGRPPLGLIWFSSSVNNWIQLERTSMKVRRIRQQEDDF